MQELGLEGWRGLGQLKRGLGGEEGLPGRGTCMFHVKEVGEGPGKPEGQEWGGHKSEWSWRPDDRGPWVCTAEVRGRPHPGG